MPKSLDEIPIQCFMSCNSLEHIELPDGIETINNAAFFRTSLKEVTIPASVTYVGGSAFGGCASLENIIFKNPHTEISCIFEKCPKLPVDIMLMSALHTPDIEDVYFKDISISEYDWICIAVEERVFLRALELNKFDGCDISELLKWLVICGSLRSVITASEQGWITAENIDELIWYAINPCHVEKKAFLLDYKNKKFGFNK